MSAESHAVTSEKEQTVPSVGIAGFDEPAQVSC